MTTFINLVTGEICSCSSVGLIEKYTKDPDYGLVFNYKNGLKLEARLGLLAYSKTVYWTIGYISTSKRFYAINHINVPIEIQQRPEFIATLTLNRLSQ